MCRYNYIHIYEGMFICIPVCRDWKLLSNIFQGWGHLGMPKMFRPFKNAFCFCVSKVWDIHWVNSYLSVITFWSMKIIVIRCVISGFRLDVDAICINAELSGQTIGPISLFHRAFFNSIMVKTPTHALFTQHYISLACWFH